eukprot:Gb_11805 [translate_table: standard]
MNEGLDEISRIYRLISRTKNQSDTAFLNANNQPTQNALL